MAERVSMDALAFSLSSRHDGPMDWTDQDIARLKRKSREPTSSPLAVAVVALRRQGLTWWSISGLLGVSVSSLRAWSSLPPQREGPAIQRARAAHHQLAKILEAA